MSLLSGPDALKPTDLHSKLHDIFYKQQHTPNEFRWQRYSKNCIENMSGSNIRQVSAIHTEILCGFL